MKAGLSSALPPPVPPVRRGFSGSVHAEDEDNPYSTDVPPEETFSIRRSQFFSHFVEQIKKKKKKTSFLFVQKAADFIWLLSLSV